jgi:hypothetical protein
LIQIFAKIVSNSAASLEAILKCFGDDAAVGGLHMRKFVGKRVSFVIVAAAWLVGTTLPSRAVPLALSLVIDVFHAEYVGESGKLSSDVIDQNGEPDAKGRQAEQVTEPADSSSTDALEQ